MMLNKNLQKCLSFSFIVLIAFAADINQRATSDALSTILHKQVSDNTHFTVIWQTTLKASYTGAGLSIKPVFDQRSWTKSISDDYKKHGFTNQKKIDIMTKSAVKKMMELCQPHSVNATAEWQFTRDGEKTLVSGTVPTPTKFQPFFNYTQFYTGNEGLIIHNASSPAFMHPDNPIAWLSPGDSTQYRCPVPEGLSLSPEHFIILAGGSLFGLYGGNWQLAATTRKSWTLISQVKPPDDSFVHYKVTISREYEGAITEIDIKPDSNPSSQDWYISKFQKYKNMWIGSQVDCISRAPGLGESHQTWILDSIKDALPISVAMPRNVMVQDYRLLGPQVTKNMLLSASSQNNSRVVYYKWKGAFPNMDELKHIYQQQHPGEASPDPSPQTGSAMPFAGGLLCLVGGAWMFKRRGVS